MDGIVQGEHVKVVRSGRRLYFETKQPRISFEFEGVINAKERFTERYNICRTGAHPILFFVERPGEFMLSSAAIKSESDKWLGDGCNDAQISIERSADREGDYCRWIYTARNRSDCSVSGQIDFFQSETVSSKVSFNLRPAGEPQCESDIFVIISVDKDARVTRTNCSRTKSTADQSRDLAPEPNCTFSSEPESVMRRSQ